MFLNLKYIKWKIIAKKSNSLVGHMWMNIHLTINKLMNITNSYTRIKRKISKSIWKRKNQIQLKFLQLLMQNSQFYYFSFSKLHFTLEWFLENMTSWKNLFLLLKLLLLIIKELLMPKFMPLRCVRGETIRIIIMPMFLILLP